ncbi:hypothetical protein [Candidatus Protochlamydia phocaeensis]|uniref:hypothetical protein n=1 Tax=Candidatus Protochlamydia phocaeensis TaxID=1414722 RepID=UPI000837AC90|nr:hypothetical protein [Candidatus Protochlamydia phocaeensis]
MALEGKIEAVKKVSAALNKQPITPPQEQLERVAPNKEHFQALMDSSYPGQSTFQKLNGTTIAPEGVQQLENNPIFAENNVSVQGNGSATDQDSQKKRHSEDDEVEGIAASGQKEKTPASLMEEVKKLNSQVSKVSRLSPEELKTQAQAVIAQIDSVKTQLGNVQSGDIKTSYQTLLRNRLTHIDDNLKIALSKAGVEYTPPSPSQVAGINSQNPVERFIGYLTHSQYQLEHLSDMVDNLNLNKFQMTPASMLALQIKVGYVQQQIELFTSLLNKALESTKTIMNVQV